MGNACSCEEECTLGTGGAKGFKKPEPKVPVDQDMVTAESAPVLVPKNAKKEQAAAPPKVDAAMEAAALRAVKEAQAQVAAEQKGIDVAGLPPLETWEVSLPQADGPLPFHYLIEEGLENVGLVGRVDVGPAAAWNKQQSGDAGRLREGDRVVRVNGEAVTHAVLAGAVKAQGGCSLLVQRWPEAFTVTLVRSTPKDRFGMKVELVERSDGVRILRVGDIRDGVLQKWNQAALAEGRWNEIVTAGSELDEVSGVRENFDAMMAKLQESTATLAVRRADIVTIERMMRDRGLEARVAG